MHRKSWQPLNKGKKAVETHVKVKALMNIKQIFHKFSRKLRGEPELPEQLLHRLISQLENTCEDELSCDEIFALVDEYAEVNLSGKDADKLMPLLRHHLDMCRECGEEYEALLRVLEGAATNKAALAL